MLKKSFDVVVVGGGPGGYVAAIHAAQRGLSVCIIEREELGGICLNWGCIPSKSLIHQATTFREIVDFEQYGLKVDTSDFRYADVHANSRKAARTLSGGIAGLMKKNGIVVIKATAKLVGPGELALSTGDKVIAGDIVLATGSRSTELKGFEFDEEFILSSTDILALDKLPESISIIGGGAIGCEFAYILNAFGVKVTLLEFRERLLPLEDWDSAKVVEKAFADAGINVLTDTYAVRWEPVSQGVDLTISKASREEIIHCEQVLVATGRVPNTRELGLDSCGVSIDDKGFVKIGSDYRTTNPNIYAIGDIVDTPALAHVASKEAEIAINAILGMNSDGLDLSLVPSAIYCEPQVASFGLCEAKANELSIPYRSVIFPFFANGKAVAVGATKGHVKLLTNPETGELLGAHIVGHNATELIHELLLTRASETVTNYLAQIMHAHPTFSEAIMEAAAIVNGTPIHL